MSVFSIEVLVEGQNLSIEFVWAENRFDGLETLAAEVIARRPSVIVSNSLAAIRANATLCDNLKFNFIRDTTPIASIARTGCSPPAPAVTSAELQAQLKPVALDLAIVRRSVEQLASNQDRYDKCHPAAAIAGR